MTDDLLTAVDKLTKPQHITNRVDDGLGGEWRVVKRTDPPLLDMLRDAIGNSLGGSGGGRQARERIPLDIGALQLLETIDGRIRAWLDELGARPGKDVTATQALRSWYVLFMAQPRTEGLEAHRATIVEGWEQQIFDRLDPPKRIEITAACPICGKEFVNIGLKLDNGEDDPNDVERVRVLNAVERERMEDSYAICSSCNRVWLGVGQMRQLRILIDDAETARNAS